MNVLQFLSKHAYCMPLNRQPLNHCIIGQYGGTKSQLRLALYRNVHEDAPLGDIEKIQLTCKDGYALLHFNDETRHLDIIDGDKVFAFDDPARLGSNIH